MRLLTLESEASINADWFQSAFFVALMAKSEKPLQLDSLLQTAKPDTQSDQFILSNRKNRARSHTHRRACNIRDASDWEFATRYFCGKGGMTDLGGTLKACIFKGMRR